MAISPEKTGTYLKAYDKELAPNIPALRVGEQVPPGDVSLAYVHTPRVNPDANMSMINTTDIYDNIIPEDQEESLVAANAEGKLEYIELVNENEIQTRAPESIFPSNNVTVTNTFKKKRFTRDSALFYRFELKYHYDSKEREADKRVQYDGNQIKITDINGTEIPSSYNYEIYVTPQAGNKRICLVEIFMHDKATENETFMVQYNHIDHVVSDDRVKSVKKKIELYSNKSNTVLEGGVLKAMMEGGKSRIINPTSVFTSAPLSDVIAEQGKVKKKTICNISARPDTDGYEITVPQKASIDSRVKNAFSFRIVANFFANDGTSMKYTTGYMTNWVINPGALLEREGLEYANEFKDISGIIGMTKMDVEEMIIRSLPPGYTRRMNAVEYTIEDDQFNKLYTDTIKGNNTQVDCRIVGSTKKGIQAKSNSGNQPKWLEAETPNVILKNNRIQHQCSVIAEKQKVLWVFKWEVFAKGKIYREDGTFKEWDSLSWKHIQGEAEVRFNTDGTYTSEFTPSKLPAEEIEELGVTELEWTDIIILEGDDDCGIEIVNNIIRHKMPAPPPIELIGVPYILPPDFLLKSEGVKKIGGIFGVNAIYEKLNIPLDIPYKDITLRIERGQSTASNLQDVTTMDFRVNYRFRITKGGYEAMPVDQYHNWFGMNRIRLVDYLDENNKLVEALSIDVVSWTMFEELEIAPIYAIKIEENRRIDLQEPRVAYDKIEHDNWYVRVKNGRFYKTIALPEYDASKNIIPQVYIAYPELIQYAPGMCGERIVTLEYEVTEYPNQEFFGYQTMIAENEQPIILDETTIKVINSPLYLESEGDKGFIEVVCIRGNRSKELRIADVDSEKGIIYLLDRIQDQDILKVRYAYKEMYYTYKGFERYEISVGTVHDPYPLTLDIDADINMRVEYLDESPIITIEGPDTILEGTTEDYTVTVTHPSENTYYHVDRSWSINNITVKKGTSTSVTYIFTITIDANDFDKNISRFIYLNGIAVADGLTSTTTKKIEIIDRPTAPVAKINKVFSDEWCTDLAATLTVTGSVSHVNKNFGYRVLVDEVERINKTGILKTNDDWSLTLNASLYTGRTSVTIKVIAEAEGMITEETYVIEIKRCGPTYIPHDYQIKLVFEYGDIIETATGTVYEEGEAGSIDSYLFLNKSKSKYINYQIRTYDNGDGKMYLDYDRVSSAKVVAGVEQKEILTIDKLKGSTITYVLHDYNGFFHDLVGSYSLSEEIKISVYLTENGENDELITSMNLDPAAFPVNTNTIVPGDFVNSTKKGYFSLFSIKIPLTGRVKLEDVTFINKQGIYFS